MWQSINFDPKNSQVRLFADAMIYHLYHLYIANWVIIFYLPPKKGNQETPLTKKNVLIEDKHVGYNIWNACMMMYDV